MANNPDVSYDATKVDPATVAALNAREDREAFHAHNDQSELREAARNREIEREKEDKRTAWAALRDRVDQIPREQLAALPYLQPHYNGPIVEHGLPDPDDPANPFGNRDATSLDAYTRALVDKAWGHTLEAALEKAGIAEPEILIARSMEDIPGPSPAMEKSMRAGQSGYLPNPDREIDEVLAGLVRPRNPAPIELGYGPEYLAPESDELDDLLSWEHWPATESLPNPEREIDEVPAGLVRPRNPAPIELGKEFRAGVQEAVLESLYKEGWYHSAPNEEPRSYEPSNRYQTSGAAAGASYKPESQRNMVDFVEGRYFQRQGIREAIQNGAILTKVEKEKTPSALEKLLERRAERKYEKAVKVAAAVLSGEIEKPASVQRREDTERAKRQQDKERW